MFEDVVGALQPILAGVNRQIKSATLEGVDSIDVSESLESELSEADSGGDTVEVRDALGDIGIDVAERRTVLENDRLAAWGSFTHPDIETIGRDEYGYRR